MYMHSYMYIHACRHTAFTLAYIVLHPIILRPRWAWHCEPARTPLFEPPTLSAPFVRPREAGAGPGTGAEAEAVTELETETGAGER